jgi:hypothetical protein
MSELYNNIAPLDRGIADRWKMRTHDNPRHKLTPHDIDAIMSPLFKTRQSTQITERHAQAIVMLVQAAGLENGAIDRIRSYVELAEKNLSFEFDSLSSDSDLSPIYSALITAPRLPFTNPKTLVTYAPNDYLAIWELVRQKKILIIQTKLGGLDVLTKDDGEYYSDSNLLIIYDRPNDPNRAKTIVHEATHAIQDWRDLRIQKRYAEADAYIADSATLRQQTSRGALEDAAFTASRLVINGTAQVGNQAWQQAYDDVVKAYQDGHPGSTSWVKTSKKGETESYQYKAVLSAVDQRAREFGGWAVDAFKSTFGGISEVGKLIP